jgi:hypothetical protein
MAFKRTYAVEIPGGTATATIQIQQAGTIQEIALSAVPAAAGEYEVSLSSTPQIGTAQADQNVLARMKIGVLTSGGCFTQTFPYPRSKVVAFQNIYVHCTGAGNLGCANITVG